MKRCEVFRFINKPLCWVLFTSYAQHCFCGLLLHSRNAFVCIFPFFFHFFPLRKAQTPSPYSRASKDRLSHSTDREHSPLVFSNSVCVLNVSQFFTLAKGVRREDSSVFDRCQQLLYQDLKSVAKGRDESRKELR